MDASTFPHGNQLQSTALHCNPLYLQVIWAPQLVSHFFCSHRYNPLRQHLHISLQIHIYYLYHLYCCVLHCILRCFNLINLSYHPLYLYI